MFSLIVAMSKNGVIGNNNKLPWSISEELKYFKKITSGNIVIMGRKTYESIGNPLKNRINIVLTKKKIENIFSVDSVEKVFDLMYTLNKENKEVFVIGGKQIYETFLPFVSKLYITIIKKNYDGDVFFPKIDFKFWKNIEEKEYKDFITKVFIKK